MIIEIIIIMTIDWIENLRIKIRIALLQKTTTLLGTAKILRMVHVLIFNQVSVECPQGPLVICHDSLPWC